MQEGLAETIRVGGVTLLIGALACGIVGCIAGYVFGGPLAGFLQNLRHRRIVVLKRRRMEMRAAKETKQ